MVKPDAKLVSSVARCIASDRKAVRESLKKGVAPPSVYPVAEAIANIFLSPNQSTKTPEHLKGDVKAVFKELNELRNYPAPPKRNAEAASIIKMLKKGYTPEQIIDTWKKIKADKFWQDKELFMMTVESQIGAMQQQASSSKFKNQKFAHLIHGVSDDPDKYIKGKYGHTVQR